MATDASPRSSRPHLLAALADVFGSMGYDGATLARLSAATGLGKASLYHHFPGGKAEMAAVLLRDAVATLEREAFARLSGNQSPGERLEAFVDGFTRYVHDGERGCLVATLARGSAGNVYGATIADQYAQWTHQLTTTFVEAGYKPKRAAREATELLADLYGALEMSRLMQDPSVFRGRVKRLKKRLPS